MPARYYDPASARFVSVDPAAPSAGDPVSLNGYSYCFGDPVNFSDPTGAGADMDGDGRQTAVDTTGSTYVANPTPENRAATVAANAALRKTGSAADAASAGTAARNQAQAYLRGGLDAAFAVRAAVNYAMERLATGLRVNIPPTAGSRPGVGWTDRMEADGTLGKWRTALGVLGLAAGIGALVVTAPAWGMGFAIAGTACAVGTLAIGVLQYREGYATSRQLALDAAGVFAGGSAVVLGKVARSLGAAERILVNVGYTNVQGGMMAADSRID